MNEMYEKEISYMIAIPKYEDELKDPALIVSRLKDAKDFFVKNITSGEDETPVLEIEYKENTYTVEIGIETYEIPEMFRVVHFFKDIDLEAIGKQEVGLMVAMEFSDDILDSYHLQLKIICTIFPETLGIMDCSAEKILSGAWAALAAKSSIPPAPRYIFTTQAVYSGDDDVWLHTHGLNRCGLMEIEIMNSTKETSNNHYHVIEAVASRLVDEPDCIGAGKPLLVASFSNDQPLMVTWVPWEKAVETVREGTLGGPEDRDEEAGHNGYTGGLFVYRTPYDMMNGIISHISIYDKQLEDNPMFMLTGAETERMRALARERVDYMKRIFLNGAKAALVKVGLEVDEQYKSEGNGYEHIWFALHSVDEDSFTAELTQEPYMVSGMHTGSVDTYSYDQITDWMMFTEEDRITPDEVYLLEI